MNEIQKIDFDRKIIYFVVNNKEKLCSFFSVKNSESYLKFLIQEKLKINKEEKQYFELLIQIKKNYPEIFL